MELFFDIISDNSILQQIGDAFIPDNIAALQDSVHHATTFLAQKVEDPDVLGQMHKAWQNFVKSGQVWALLIGTAVGYLFKSFTSY
jgi:hypothetical protein